MNNSIDFLYAVYFISIIIVFVGMVVNLVHLLPLYLKLVKVRNGLSKLRKLMLIQNIMNQVLGIGMLIVLSARFFVEGDLARYMIVILVFGVAASYFAFIITWAVMFRQQFTDEQIMLHDKIADK